MHFDYSNSYMQSQSNSNYVCITFRLHVKINRFLFFSKSLVTIDTYGISQLLKSKEKKKESNEAILLFSVFFLFFHKLFYFYYNPHIFKRKREMAFFVVASLISSKLTPLSSAIFSAINFTYAGSFLFPRYGCGVKNGASVSINNLSRGT